MGTVLSPAEGAATESATISWGEPAEPRGSAQAAEAVGGGRRPIPKSQLLMTISQLAVMSCNGIDLADALETAARSTRHVRLQRVLEEVHSQVSGGQRLSDAISQQPSLPQELGALLAAAESSGSVPKALRRMGDLLRSQLTLRGAIVGALIYPTILMTASMVVMVALLFFVLPQFGNVFASMNRPVPALTQMLLSVGAFGQDYWPFLLAAGGVAIVSAVCFWNHPALTAGRDRLLLYAPLLRDAYRPLTVGRMLKLIASMLAGGVPLLQAIQLTRAGINNGRVGALLDEIEDDLIAGLPASRAMADCDFLPDETAQMVAIAERTGRLAEVLADVGDYYEEEGARRLKRLVHMLEPIIILLMGCLVSAIVLSIMLPLLDMSTLH